jgi:hypothetical protein
MEMKMEVRCKCGELMELEETDSRQEWTEETYRCECGKAKIHRTEYDQVGLVTKDEIYDEE